MTPKILEYDYATYTYQMIDFDELISNVYDMSEFGTFFSKPMGQKLL